MNCYFWELQALLEGCALRLLDEREILAENAFNLRYVMNSKKPKPKKVFNKEKEEEKIKKLFTGETQQNRVPVNNIKAVNDYFRGKEWG